MGGVSRPLGGEELDKPDRGSQNQNKRGMQQPATAVLVPPVAVHADDWAQYRGPNQDGISAEAVKPGWGGDGPQVVWKVPTNSGFSSFAICDGRAFTQVVREIAGTPVCKDGYLYGIFCFKKFKTGPLKCVELATGKIVWEQRGFGQGNVTLVGDRLLALTDYGDLVVVEATPTAYKELARTKAVEGKCWSTPSLSDGMIYVRSTTQGKCLK